jgi:hypothetical protein
MIPTTHEIVETINSKLHQYDSAKARVGLLVLVFSRLLYILISREIIHDYDLGFIVGGKYEN